MKLSFMKSFFVLFFVSSSVLGWDGFSLKDDNSPFYFKLRDQYHRLFNGIDDPRNISKSYNDEESRSMGRLILKMTKAIGID